MLTLESSKGVDTIIIIAMRAMINVNSDFIIAIHLKATWKIDELKIGGALSFFPAPTSLDITQPADIINPVATRHLIRLQPDMTRTDNVVIYAADMQTQHNVSDDKDKAITRQVKHCVINDILSMMRISMMYQINASKCNLDHVTFTNNGCRDKLILHLEKCKGTVEIHCFLIPSCCNYDKLTTKTQHNFRRGLL
jgi:hypothetical protein